MTLAKLVEDYITKHKLTKLEFCKKAGVSEGALHRTLKGEGIYLVNFKKIVQALDYEIHLKPKQIKNSEAA